MDRLQVILDQMELPDIIIREEVAEAWDQKTKPPGSLGRLEGLVAQIAGISGQIKPSVARKAIVVMCGDHGVVNEGISAYPQDVTQLMMDNFAKGGAAINVLARETGAQLHVVDVGSSVDYPSQGIISRKVRKGTGNMAVEPAMERKEAIEAILQGVNVAQDIAQKGIDLIALGEMGIGNTTPSAAMIACLTQHPVEGLVGRGTGINDDILHHKEAVIRQALSIHQPQTCDPLDVLSKVGGLEIAGLAGVIFGAVIHRVPVVVDGVIATAAALVAVKMAPKVKHYLIASHLSQEPAHRIALEHLELMPVIHLDMRLGEGTGAALLFPILDAGVRLFNEMATFADIGMGGHD